MSELSHSMPGDFLLIWGLNLLLQVTLLSAVGLTVATCLRRNPTARYGVLCSTLILMLLSPAIAFVMQRSGRSLLSVSMMESNVAPRTERDGNDAPNIDHPAIIPVHNDLPLEFVDRRDGSETLHSEPLTSTSAEEADSGRHFEDLNQGRKANAVSILNPKRSKSMAAASVVIETQATRFSQILHRVMPPLLIGWVAGAVLLLVRLAWNWFRLGAILRSARPNANGLLAEVFEQVGDELHIEQMPELVLSDRVSGPISVNLFRRCVVLPELLVERMSAEQLHDLFVHEIAHILRRDQLIVLLQNVTGAVFWLHPLVRVLNRSLGEAREEVCDNYVLSTSSAPAYSRTLLALAELIQTRREIPGAVGLFASRWKLENRVAGLLDEKRSHAVELRSRAKLLIAALLLVIATVAALGTVTLAAQQDPDDPDPSARAAPEKAKDDLNLATNEDLLLRGPTLRGTGQDREMLIRGRVFDMGGEPARGFELVTKLYKDSLGPDVFPTRIEGSEFEVWMPIDGSHPPFLTFAATAKNGNSRAVEIIGGRELRQTAIEGIDLRLAPANRTVEISVTHNGIPVANAHVNAQLVSTMVLQSKTDSEGKTTFRLREDEDLQQLTAWTDDFRIGGHDFNRAPRRDPHGEQFTIELDDCREQKVRFLNAEDNSPVPNVRFNLVVSTGEPNFDFAAVPKTFPPCRMTTNEQGEATSRWFPDWASHWEYVDIIDPHWAKALEELETATDGALVMKLKPRGVPRNPLVGKVTSDRSNVGGLLVEFQSFQGEEVNYSDHLCAFTDENGNFMADCLPGSTYCVYVNDADLVSDIIDLIPYDPVTGKSRRADLHVTKGRPVEIYLTAGPDRAPLQDQLVRLEHPHPYSWYENGEKRHGTGASRWSHKTDHNGIVRTRARAGSELVLDIYADTWRLRRRTVVGSDEPTLIDIYREVADEREVSGQLVLPEGLEADLTKTVLEIGSLDGETLERLTLKADSEGHFSFKSSAVQLGIFAYTTDGKAAVLAKLQHIDKPLQLQLQPTVDVQGQLVGKNNEPLADYPVRSTLTVVGEGDKYDKPQRTDFTATTFQTTTNREGKYTLAGLPREVPLMLLSDTLDKPGRAVSLYEFYCELGETPPFRISRPWKQEDQKQTLSQRYEKLLRYSVLGDCHAMVVISDNNANEFVRKHLLETSDSEILEFMKYVHLVIREADLADKANLEFAQKKNWPKPIPGKLSIYALDVWGKELGRIELDYANDDAIDRLMSFVIKHAPPQADAKQKWDEAFAEAKRSNRKVWARINQRYCQPCFELSAWLDDHRSLLDQDYVFLKIDDVRDLHGREVAQRLISKKWSLRYGVPFHAIFDANEKMLIDSRAPTGNIGYPSGHEGRKHLRKMLSETNTYLSTKEINQLMDTLRE